MESALQRNTWHERECQNRENGVVNRKTDGKTKEQIREENMVLTLGKTTG